MGNAPSRFVGDIEAALKEIQERLYRPPERKPESGQMSLFLRSGCAIRGRIVEIDL